MAKKIKSDFSTQRTLKQFGFYSTKKALNANSRITKAYQEAPNSTIGIPYRTCGDGKGVFYDHYTLQKTTNTATQILKESTINIQGLLDHIKQSTQPLLKQPKNLTNVNPEAIENDSIEESEFGLLYIPGVARDNYKSSTYPSYKEYQSTLIKKAINEGRPMLAVCGGCWQLWEEFEGKTKEVKDHNYRGGMPRIKETTGKVGHNKQVHRIRFEENSSILASAMRFTEKNSEGKFQIKTPNVMPPVNSVHWRAPCEKQIPQGLNVSATSVADATLAPHFTHNEETRTLDPEKCIEAFESTYGAPIIGVQWHPEAYMSNTPEEHYPKNQADLLQYMVEAGKTFMIKKTLIAELSTIFRESKKQTPQTRHSLKVVKIDGKRVLSRTGKRDGLGSRLTINRVVTHSSERIRRAKLIKNYSKIINNLYPNSTSMEIT